MKALEVVDSEFLWRRNCSRPWINHLISCFESGYGKDFETIDFWITQFKVKVPTTLIVDRNYTIMDGHHRLVAAKLANVEEIQVVICPQRCTYGR